MANDVQFTRKKAGTGVRAFQWVLPANSNGKPVYLGAESDITVQCYGTFGAAATFEWSNDERADFNHADHANAKWVSCRLASDGTTAFSLTADGGAQILEGGAWFRPVTAGVTSVTFEVKGG